MKRALVMTGGAARGAFMTGVVDGLVQDQGLDFEVLAGVSIGALIATNLAQAPLSDSPEKNRRMLSACNAELIESVRLRLPTSRWLRYWPLIGKRRRRVMRQIVESTIRLDNVQRSGRRLLTGAVDLWTGQWRLRDETTLSEVDELLGMMAIPLLDPPVRIGQDMWVDGILRRTAPVEEVLLERVDEIYIVAAGFPPIGPSLRARGLFRALAIALGEFAYDKEIRLAHLAERTLGRPRVVLIRPGHELNSHMSLSHRDFDFALAHGRSQANRACEPGNLGLFDDLQDDEIPERVRQALSDRPSPSYGSSTRH